MQTDALLNSRPVHTNIAHTFMDNMTRFVNINSSSSTFSSFDLFRPLMAFVTVAIGSVLSQTLLLVSVGFASELANQGPVFGLLVTV
jgi:hypothetical protein